MRKSYKICCNFRGSQIHFEQKGIGAKKTDKLDTLGKLNINKKHMDVKLKIFRSDTNVF